MTHPKRFTDAVTKLYNAFHEDRLDAWDCKSCAVGNICDNKNDWSAIRWTLNGKFRPEFFLGEAKAQILKTGYSPFEILTIENVFTGAMEFEKRFEKESQFNGLSAVIEYLCELDNIPNIMDYKTLFETENDKPKVQLETVFA